MTIEDEYFGTPVEQSMFVQDIEMRISEATTAYENATKKVKTERIARERFTEDWADERQEHYERMSGLNNHIEALVKQLGETIPSSVWPSLIIDDPKAPALDEKAAADMKDAISGMGYDEVAELVRLQDALIDLRIKREAAIGIWEVNSKNFPKRIKQHEDGEKAAVTLLKAARKELDDALKARPPEVTQFLLSQGIGALEPERFPPPKSLPAGYMGWFQQTLDDDDTKNVSSAKQLAEKDKKNKSRARMLADFASKLDPAAGQSRARALSDFYSNAANNVVEQQERIAELEASEQREKERADKAEAEAAAKDQRIKVLAEGVIADANKTPAEILARRKHIYLKPHPADIDRDTGRMKAIGHYKLFLNERQPVGSNIDVCFRGDAHAQREMAFRVGIHETARRFPVFVIDHTPFPHMPDGNIFLVEHKETGRRCRMALGGNHQGEYVVLTCLNENTLWNAGFENRFDPEIPAGIARNNDYTIEQLLAYHKLLALKLLDER